MKILLNGLQAGNRSGTGRYTVELARRLAAKEDVELRLACPRDLAAPEGVGNGALSRHSAGALSRLAYDQAGIRREARRWAADLVHFPANIGPIATMRNAVLTIHDLSFYRDPSWFKMSRALYYRTAVGQSAHSAARIIADSRATADDVHAYLGIPNTSIDVAPLGVDEHFSRADDDAIVKVIERYKLPTPFFLFVGTVEPRKNVAQLICAWDKVARELDHGLVIAGRDGWKTAVVDAAIGGVSQSE
ncbi:MAG: glycosyltransferase family 1 protein, partial [Candidatus Hydrogenedentales bacterium]